MKRILILLFIPLFSLSQNNLNMNLLGSIDYTTTNGNDIWGWVDQSGNEFAIVGLRDGISVVDVTDPVNPIEIFFINDIYSTWRDIKTWDNYAYVTTESDTGLLIIDLNDMTGNTYYHRTVFNNPNGQNVEFTAAHNLYIDENGIAYIFGASSNTGSWPSYGAIFLDLNVDPINPIYLGEWDDHYVHDGMVRGDTLYAASTTVDNMFVIEISDKTNPIVLGQVATPSNNTHNVWVSDDGNYVFTSDETSGGYVTSYDITDVTNIQELDRIQSSPGSNCIPHNAFVDGNFLVVSYYKDGTVVYDITHPENMVEVAYYDSYSGSGYGFDGCWGTYPYLPSGNIISSEINSGVNGEGQLLIYQRDFQQACYANGNVYDANTGAAISNATITILNTGLSTNTNLFGFYQSSVLDSGNYQVVFSAFGYENDTVSAVLDNGVNSIIDAYLLPSCLSPKPDSLYVFDIIDSRVKIGWRNMNSSECRVLKYYVRYREIGSPSWVTKSAGAGSGLCLFGLNTTTKQMINLNPNTTYEFKMKAFYCNGLQSGYSAPIQFTTADICSDMINLTASTFNNNPGKVNFNWNTTGPYVFSRIKYRVDTAGSLWQNAGGFGIYYPVSSINSFGLQSSTSYRAHGRLFCDSNITAYRSLSWTNPPVFWTQPGLPIRDGGGISINDLSVFPNPSTGSFYIGFNSEVEQNIKIVISNLLGEELYYEEIENCIGEFNRRIDLDSYNSAIYLINIESDDSISTTKLIIN